MAMDLLKKNTSKIDWYALSSNNSNGALDILEKNPLKINYTELCKNTNDRAIKILKEKETYTYNISQYWDVLSNNHNSKALTILKRDQNSINWQKLSSKPYIFELNTKKILSMLI